MEYQILLYYKYIFIENPEKEMKYQKNICEYLRLRGRIIIAREGINGTVEGIKENTEKYIKEMKKDPRYSDIHWKKSKGNGESFSKLSVKVRKEIVSLCLGETFDVNPNKITGARLKPEELHNWIKENKEFYIVDMRNVYEHKVGHFDGSILLPMDNFRDLPRVVEQISYLKEKTVLTVCTGGVRCEKASGFLITQGFKDVYQLDGGIVSYMEKYPNENFKGKLYVFDGRIIMGFNTDDPRHQVIGKCDICGDSTENYVNCSNLECHKHFISCKKCVEARQGKIFCPNKCTISRHGKPVLQNVNDV